jgi:hypothetical protein
MFNLQVSCHAMSHNCVFIDKASAEVELANLQTALNEGRWSKNREEKPTHTIKCLLGDVVVVLEKVEVVRLVDSYLEKETLQSLMDETNQENLQKLIKDRVALKNAGVLLTHEIGG